MGLTYLLDTDICIYLSKFEAGRIYNKLDQLATDEAAMSVITYGEMLYGIYNSKRYQKNKQILESISHIISPLPLTVDTTEHYGRIRYELQKKGSPIGSNDLWIAAHALSLDVTLVTNNQKEFKRVKGLKLENWV